MQKLGSRNPSSSGLNPGSFQDYPSIMKGMSNNNMGSGISNKDLGSRKNTKNEISSKNIPLKSSTMTDD